MTHLPRRAFLLALLASSASLAARHRAALSESYRFRERLLGSRRRFLGSGKRPCPSTPHAIRPSSGASTDQPSLCSVSRCLRIGGALSNLRIQSRGHSSAEPSPEARSPSSSRDRRESERETREQVGRARRDDQALSPGAQVDVIHRASARLAELVRYAGSLVQRFETAADHSFAALRVRTRATLCGRLASACSPRSQALWIATDAPHTSRSGSSRPPPRRRATAFVGGSSPRIAGSPHRAIEIVVFHDQR